MDLSRWLVLVAVAACGVLGQTIAAWGTERESFAAAMGVFALGGWLLTRLDTAEGRLPLDGVPSSATVPRPSVARLAMLIAAALLAAVAALDHAGEWSLLQVLCWSGSLLALLGFAWSSDRAGVRAGPATSFTAADVATLAGLSALALFLRLWQLDQIPALIWDDEILYLADGMRLVREIPLSPFASCEWGAPCAHAYSMAVVSAMIDDRVVAMRLVSALPGALTVPLLYLAMRELFDRRFAFVAGLLLAVSAWHVILSRQGYVWAINGFAEAAAIWGLARGFRRGRLVDFALSGFALGLGFVYSYAAALMPGVFVLLGGWLLLRGRALLRPRLAGILFLGLCFTAFVAPRVAALWANPDMRGYQTGALLSPGEESSAWEAISTQFEQISQSFNRRADNNELFVPAPKEPLLDPITAAALGIGFFWALFSFAQLGPPLLLLTFAVMLVPPAIGLSSTEWATAWRACGVVPGLFGLAAAPFAMALGAARSRPGRAVIGTLVASLLIMVAFINVYAYFVRHASKPRWFYGHNATRMGAARSLLAAVPGTRILVNHDVDFAHVEALAIGRRRFKVFAWPDDTLLPDLFGDEPRRALVISGAQLYWEDDIAVGAVLIDLLRHYYPGGRGEVVYGSDHRPLLATFDADADAVRDAHGLAPVEGGFGGTLVIRAADDYELRSGAESARISVDGHTFSRGFLAAGLHSIEVRGAAGADRLSWTSKGKQESVPLRALLRRGLPAWGLREQTRRDGQLEWERWVPVTLFGGEREVEPDTRAQLEWSGDIVAPQESLRTLMLMTRAPTSIWIDGSQVLAEQPSETEWRRIPVALAPGWHRLRVLSGPPIDHHDLRLYAIDGATHPVLLGGVASRPSESSPAAAAPRALKR